MNKYKDNTAIGIVTCNRPDFYSKCVKSIDPSVGKLYVINAGTEKISKIKNVSGDVKGVNKNLPVAIAKNTLIRKMRENEENKYIFILDDDIEIADNTVFEKYIDTATVTGLWGCLSYGGHGHPNRTSEGIVAQSDSIEYDGVIIDIYTNAVSAFTLYHRNIFREIGFFDERFVNTVEYVDHYCQQYVKGIAPPFWCFPDIHESWKYITDIDRVNGQTIIRNLENSTEVFSKGWELFKQKRSMYPNQIPKSTKDKVIEILAGIEKNYGKPVAR